MTAAGPPTSCAFRHAFPTEDVIEEFPSRTHGNRKHLPQTLAELYTLTGNRHVIEEERNTRLWFMIIWQCVVLIINMGISFNRAAHLNSKEEDREKMLLWGSEFHIVASLSSVALGSTVLYIIVLRLFPLCQETIHLTGEFIGISDEALLVVRVFHVCHPAEGMTYYLPHHKIRVPFYAITDMRYSNGSACLKIVYKPQEKNRSSTLYIVPHDPMRLQNSVQDFLPNEAERDASSAEPMLSIMQRLGIAGARC